ncbi:MAG: HD domain-containing protein [Promethearchaeota archaeon]
MEWKKINKPIKIYDSVFGFIELNENEADIIQHPLFQRLKNIKQLGFSYYVFPGATHTRFSHSLGVFYLVKELISNINNNSPNKISKDDEADIRMASLLHDIGHYPFSHCLESFFSPKKHELNGKEILKESDINDYLLEKSYNTEKIFNIITGEYIGKDQNDIYLRQLLNSDLDCDRLDYLIRDSHNSGTPFGNIDVDNILRNAVIIKGELNFYNKAIRSIDHYLNARVSMYDTVYTHKTSMVFDLMFSRICEILQDLKLINFKDIIKGHYPILESFLFFDDNFTLSEIYRIYRFFKRKHNLTSEENGAFELIKKFLARVPFKLIFEQSSFFMRKKNADYVRDPEQNKKISNKINNFNDIFSEWLVTNQEARSKILHGKPSDIIFSKGFPQLAMDPSEKDKTKFESIKIYDKVQDKSEYIFNCTNSIIFFLSSFSLTHTRIYADNTEFQEKIQKLWEKSESD